MPGECRGGGGGDGGGGCLCFALLLIWMVFYGGCELPADLKAIRKSLEQQAAAKP